VLHVAVSGDGAHATGRWGRAERSASEVRIWDREMGKILCEYPGPAPIVIPFHGGIALSGDGRRVAFDVCVLQGMADNGVLAMVGVKVFDVDTARNWARWPAPTASLGR
jgi:hypothetical protein